MTKQVCVVKLKRKDGTSMVETWRDGSVHETPQAACMTVLQGDDGRPPYVVLSEEFKFALIRGGLKLDDFYLNYYNDTTKVRPAAKAGRTSGPPPSADELFE